MIELGCGEGQWGGFRELVLCIMARVNVCKETIVTRDLGEYSGVQDDQWGVTDMTG